jgi:hypothetical protein
MVAPTFKRVTNPNPGTPTQYGALDIHYLFDVLDGTHATDRIQASVIEGLPRVYNATVELEGSTVTTRNANNTVISSGSASSTSVVTAALQAAINEAGHIYIGPGTYNTEATLTVPSNTHVEADINAIIRGRPFPNSHPVITNENMTLDQSGGNNSYIIIEGGTWDGNSRDDSVHSNIANVHLEGVSFGWVNRVRSLNSVSEGIKVTGGDRAWITNCYVDHSKLDSNGSGKSGTHATAKSHDVIQANNIIDDAGGQAMGSNQDCDRILIVNNVCRYRTRGRGYILLEGNSTSNQHIRDALIANNTVSAKYQCIHIQSCNGVVIANNSLTNVGVEGGGNANADGIKLGGINRNILIRGNYIHDVYHHGMHFTNDCTNLFITNNLIKNVGQEAPDLYDGISFETSGPYDNVKISHNIIADDRTTRHMRYGIRYEAVGSTQTMNNHWVHHNQIYGYLTDSIRSPWVGSGRFTGERRFYSNSGFNPGDRIAAPFNNTNNEIGLPAYSTALATYSALPIASRTYTVAMSPISVTSTGGTGVAITVEEPSASFFNMVANATTLRALYMPPGWRINFGAFSSAPTVTVVGL